MLYRYSAAKISLSIHEQQLKGGLKKFLGDMFLDKVLNILMYLSYSVPKVSNTSSSFAYRK